MGTRNTLTPILAGRQGSTAEQLAGEHLAARCQFLLDGVERSPQLQLHISHRVLQLALQEDRRGVGVANRLAELPAVRDALLCWNTGQRQETL